MIKLLHSGDIGDIIASLPILKELGGGTIILTETLAPGGPRESMRGDRFEAISPLLRAQPYVHAVKWMDAPEGVTHDLSAFRVKPWIKGETLSEWQARCLGLQLPADYANGWLTVPKHDEPHGLVVMARSTRYHNYFFPWDELIRFNPTALFVGHPKEHEDIELETHRKITFRPTKDLLALAEVIMGARLTICNQSAPFWIAAGCGSALIQETYAEQANSIIRRENAIYTLTGPLTRTLIYRLYPPSRQREAVGLTRSGS